MKIKYNADGIEMASTDIPSLESKIALCRDVMSQLTIINTKLNQNKAQRSEFTEAVRSAEVARLEVQEISQIALDKINEMRASPIYNPEHLADLVQAELSIHVLHNSVDTLNQFITKLKSNTPLIEPMGIGLSTSNLTTELKQNLISQINTHMQPIEAIITSVKTVLSVRLENLETTYKQFVHDNALSPFFIVELELESANNPLPNLYGLEKSIEKIKGRLAEPNLNINNSIREDIDALEVIFNDRKTQFAIFQQTETRKTTDEAKAIISMQEKIQLQINDIADLSDPRDKILKEIITKLDTTLKNYYTDITKTPKIFISDSITVLQEELSGPKLNQLSDLVAGPFIDFIRSLLKPIDRLIKALYGNTYKPQFFATNTETSLANAAKTAHAKLNEIHTNLNNRISTIENGHAFQTT